MVKTMINYQLYIIIGILIFPIFAFIVYFIKKLLDRVVFMKTLHDMKKPLMERINSIECVYEIKEKKEEMNMIIEDIKSDIDILKQEIHTSSQETLELEKIDQIEKEITMFYNRIHAPQTTETKQSEEIFQDSTIAKQTPQEIYEKAILQQQAYQSQVHQEKSALHKEQIKVMNENISKFLVVYKEKDKVIDEKNRAIDEKNKSIYILQQKLIESEQRIKKFIAEQQDDKSKDRIIEEKTMTIGTLQQRLQEVENKFSKIALLHKSITEKEEIKDKIIEEKNNFIANLQYKLSNIEAKLESMMTVNEDNKDKILSKKLLTIDQQIKAEKKKNRIFIILFMLFLLMGIGGFTFIYTNYIQNIATFAI